MKFLPQAVSRRISWSNFNGARGIQFFLYPIRFRPYPMGTRISSVLIRGFDRHSTYLGFPGQTKLIYENSFEDHKWWNYHSKGLYMWILLYGPAAIMLAINANTALADSGTEEDESAISNVHTVKWRLLTDEGRDLFMKGRHEEAESCFLSAIDEAKEGFGERDPHVASACNNLAEIYRIKKAFDKAEPLYFDAIDILEDSYGTEDFRVGIALHNLGLFYIMQRKLEQACSSYERALEIKKGTLIYGYLSCADTMYHLAVAYYLRGNVNDAIVLLEDSIPMLENDDQGESDMCVRTLRYLAQIYMKSQRFSDAEKVQRRILHIFNSAKGLDSLESTIVAQDLAVVLYSLGKLGESKEILEHSYDVLKALTSEGDIKVAMNMRLQARVAVLYAKQLRESAISEAIAEIARAKHLFDRSIRIARGFLDSNVTYKDITQHYGATKASGRDVHDAVALLLQSLDEVGLLNITMLEYQQSTEIQSAEAAEEAFTKCIATFKEFRAEMEKDEESEKIRRCYVSCLTDFLNFLRDGAPNEARQSRVEFMQELESEISTLSAQFQAS